MSFIHTSAMMHDYTVAPNNFDRCNDCGLVFPNTSILESELGALSRPEIVIH
jgi:hypothetical protein